MYPYPSFYHASMAARAVRGLVQSANFGPNIGQLANDLWTLQGYAQYYIVGNPRPTYGSQGQEFEPPRAFDASQDVSDAEAQQAIDVFLNTTDPQTGQTKSLFESRSINWGHIFLWCRKMMLLLISRHTVFGAPGEGPEAVGLEDESRKPWPDQIQ